jgi:membrane-bound serine protease (ClpP class)
MDKKLVFLTIALLFVSIQLTYATDNVVFKIDIKREIGSTTWLHVQKGFEEARERNADVVLIHLNTYGGEVVYADSIRTKILNSELPVHVFIDNNAASAGALISIACDKIFMRPGGSIGAATVVNQSGSEMPDKYQSYMRATMRATAEAQGKDTIVTGNDTIYRWRRDPLIAEAMVDERTVVPNLIDSGRTLTFTALEAIEYGYCDGLADNVDDLITRHLNLSEYELIVFMPTTMDNIRGFLMSSVFQAILIMLIIGGIYFELQTPGVGFPIIVSLTAALLYFAPLYIEGLAANWEIIVFVIGLVLIAIEVFVIPGFGVAGISGIVMVVAGLTLSMIDNVNFNFENVETGGVGEALMTVVAGVAFGIGLVIYLSSRIGSKGIFRSIALTTNLQKSEGYISVEMSMKDLVGQDGVAHTDLRPSGKVKIKGTLYDAVSSTGFIAAGTSVRIVRFDMAQIYVDVL